MPYKRSYGKRKRYSRRSRGSRGGFWNSFSKNYKTVSKFTNLATVWDAITKLQGLVNSEMHKLDVSNSGNILSTGTLDSLCKVAVGDTYADRTGNSIYARALNVNGVLTWGSAAAAPQVVRLAIILDTQQISDTDPVYTDVYEAASSIAHLNPATVGRFKILYSKQYHLETNNQLINFKINCAMRHHIRYNGTAGTDIQKGALYLAYIGSQPVSNYPQISYRSRLSFHDN